MRFVLTLVLLLVPMAYLRPLDEDMLLFWRRSGDSPCEPFTNFMSDCNKCVCGAEGVMYCTKMLCSKKDNLEDYTDTENDYENKKDK